MVRSGHGCDQSAKPPSRFGRLLDTYFRVKAEQDHGKISTTLWHGREEPTGPAELSAYRTLVLEQHKIYAEMADRVSARRGLANTSS